MSVNKRLRGDVLRFLDLFAGIGGFRLGMTMAGHKPVGWVEWDKFARKSYEAMYDTKGEWTAHDITKVSDDDIRSLRGRVDVITGGFPCQAFSIAGKRRGFEDTRGTLFFEIARFANIIRPRYLFLENVKGLLNHAGGDTFETILRTLDELGYDAEWDVLNSKDFGVPQNRERVFIIGHLRGERTRKIFPIGQSHSVSDTKRVEANPSISALTATDYKGPSKQRPNLVVPTLQELTQNMPDAQRVYDPAGLARTLKAEGGGQGAKTGLYAIPTLTPDRDTKRQNGRRFKEPGEPMFTLTAQDKHGVMLGNMRIRRLTPRECWRLQGFPDWAFDKAQEVNSDTQLYKQAGNAVTVNVIYEIAKKMI